MVVDAFSKWLECICMSNGTSTHALIVKLKGLFAMFGIPDLLVSDNDVKINSIEFNNFCANNGIKYMTSPVYHPCSNGQAENSVKTCKNMLKRILNESTTTTSENVSEKLLGFLFEYRNSTHCTTGATPAKLMLERDLKSRLDLVFPKQRNVLTENCKNSRCLKTGDIVWARWFIQRKEHWTLGTIKNTIGNRMYEVLIKDNGVVCKRHID